MKNFLLLLFISSTVIMNIIAQENKQNDKPDLTGYSFSLRMNPYKKSLDGNPLLFEEAHKGEIIIKGFENANNNILPINYNYVSEELIIKLNGQDLSFDISKVDSLLFLNVTGDIDAFVFGQEVGSDKNELLQVLVEGEFPLLRTTRMKLIRPNYNPVLMTGNKNYSLRTNVVFFTMTGGEFQVLPKRTKRIIKSDKFGVEFKKEVKRIKPSLKNEQDIIDFFLSINK